MGTQHCKISTFLHHACRLLCMLVLGCGALCVLTSCRWHEAKDVIAMADSLDQTAHVIYDDTAALGSVIRCLDNPLGRVLMSNTLGKAYYYMGRNLEDSYQQIVAAAECYIDADRLQIEDPIYRGRVNSCMGYICSQNNVDSIALIFYKRACEDFKESSNEWRYAQMLLTIAHHAVNLNQQVYADSILQLAKEYQCDSAFRARYYETRGLYFYEQQQYDSALVYFNQGLDYWQSEEDKCFSYLKVMQSHYFGNISMDSAVHYAHKLLLISHNPNYISNACYCLMQDAKINNNVELLSQYSHVRTDALKLLRESMVEDAEAIPVLDEYVKNPHPWRWVQITLFTVFLLCLSMMIGVCIYRKRSSKQLDILSKHIRTQEADILYQQSLLAFEKGLTEIVDKYHSPRNYWMNYSALKKDIAPWLRDWTAKLDMLPLSEKEKIFCIISLIYTNLSDIEIENYMCYAKGRIRILKNRILKKIGISSSEFSNFLHDLSNCK